MCLKNPAQQILDDKWHVRLKLHNHMYLNIFWLTFTILTANETHFSPICPKFRPGIQKRSTTDDKWHDLLHVGLKLHNHRCNSSRRSSIISRWCTAHLWIFLRKKSKDMSKLTSRTGPILGDIYFWMSIGILYLLMSQIVDGAQFSMYMWHIVFWGERKSK